MSSAITYAGESLIARLQGEATGLDIDRIVLALVPDQDFTIAVDRAEGMPDAESIVLEYDIPAEYKGYVNPNQVVYSMLLGSDVGDFSFNWLGLYSSTEDTVVAITHLPATEKRKTDGATLGNNLTRNFLIEFSGAQELTGVTVEAATWQVDFTVRLHGIDERERLSNRDMYGRAKFFEDAFLLVNNEGVFSLHPGAAYVEGVRIALAAEQVVSPGALPKDVWLDVALLPQGSDVVAVAGPTFGFDLNDYQDAAGISHYLQKVAEIDGAGNVTDVRQSQVSSGDEGLLGGMEEHAGRTDNPHGTTAAQVGATPASHATNTSNPHSVTAAQVGAAAAEHSHTAAEIGATPASHATNTSNPHGVTAAQAGAAALNHTHAGYTSSLQTLVAGGTLALTHGLGAAPVRFQCSLVCQSDELGWTAGQEVFVGFHEITTAANGLGCAVRADATKIYIQFGNNAAVFSIIRATDGNGAAITASKWKFRIRAWR